MGRAGRICELGEWRRKVGAQFCAQSSYLNIGVFILEANEVQALRCLRPCHLPPGVGQLSTIPRVESGNPQSWVALPAWSCRPEVGATTSTKCQT